MFEQDTFGVCVGTTTMDSGHRLQDKIGNALGPRAFHFLRRIFILGRHFFGITYDADYAYVRGLKSNCTIIDIGANGGQSAIEFARLRPDAKIISFEANQDNLKDLDLARRLIGPRYSYHHVALSDRSGEACLYVPIVGNTPVPGEASLEPELLEDVQDRIGKITTILKHPVSLRTLDSFALAPDFVKIDVQGHEPAVLRGMARTIEAHRPAIMIERGADFDTVRKFLDHVGYKLFIYDRGADQLVPCEVPNTGNFVALPGSVN